MPYAKWAGTSMIELPRARATAASLHQALDARDWPTREAALVEAFRALHRPQTMAGLPAVNDPVGPFWDRRYQGIRDEVIERLKASVTDPAVRALPRGLGSVEQWSSNVDVLVNPARRLSMYPRDEPKPL